MKFNYLRRYLAEDAASTIAGLATMQACYKDAAEILRNRFGDKRRIEHHYVSVFRFLPHVKTGTDTKELRKLYDTTLLNMRCLRAHGVETTGFATMLCDILNKALLLTVAIRSPNGPNVNVQTAGTTRSSLTPSKELKNLSNFLHMEVECR